MVINIAASHRFHLLDLARELSNQGHTVNFYAYVPKKRMVSFGLQEFACKSLFYVSLPFLGLVKLSKQSEWSIKLLNLFLDQYVAMTMPKCDVFIGLGTVYLKSFEAAKKRFGAKTILEWGSKHIEVQQEILGTIDGTKKQSYYFTKRSVEVYYKADFIAISSDHVKQSFIDKGIDPAKLIQNPYGVDLSMFHPTALDSENTYDLIMVGGWSYRKGCDLLTKVCKAKNYTLLHVGPIVDLPFPADDKRTHIDAVDQKLLINYYKKAKVFVLPSREEGLAMVQPQALVCGLPIVCSKDTGGRDLKSFIDDEKYILEMNEFSETALIDQIEKGLALAKTQIGLRNYAENVGHKLDWKAYGKRYSDNLKNILKLQ